MKITVLIAILLLTCSSLVAVEKQVTMFGEISDSQCALHVHSTKGTHDDVRT